MTEMTTRHWRVFLMVCLLWGSMYIIVKKALPAFTALELVAWRYVFAGLFFLPLALRQHDLADRSVERGRNWPWFFLIGVSGSFGPVLFTTLAQRTEPSALAGMFAAFTPIVTALFARVLLKEQVTSKAVGGLLLGVAGASLLVLSRSGWNLVSGISLGSLWFMGACILWAATAMLIRLRLQAVPSLTLATYSMAALIPLSLLVLAAGGAPDSMLQSMLRLFTDPHALWFWLTVLMQMSCIVLYNWLIVHAGPVNATAVTYVVPFVSLAWGLLDGEKLFPMQLAGLALVLLGLFLLNQQGKKPV
jgi:drug/metabolite transporter (DMT)-like permease